MTTSTNSLTAAPNAHEVFTTATSSAVFEFHGQSDEWDLQIENDIRSGKLDAMAEGALKEFRDGHTTPFPPEL